MPHLLVLGGAMRSGTTLLKRLIESHPQVRLMALELRAFRYAELATWAHVAAVSRHFASERASIRHKEFRGQVYRYLSHILRGFRLSELVTVDRIHSALSVTLGDGAVRYIGDKYPDYVLQYAQFIHRPKTRCVFVYRDARDVVASLLERIQRGIWQGRTWATKYDNVEKATDYWLTVMQVLCDIRRLETNALLVRYEDLVLRTAESIAAIAQHLQLRQDGFDARVPDASSIGRHGTRLGRDQVQGVERRAGPMMQAWGYALDRA